MAQDLPSTVFFPKTADPKQLYLRESESWSQDFFSANFRVKRKTSVKRISSLRFFLSSLMQHVKGPSTGAQFTTKIQLLQNPNIWWGGMYETEYIWNQPKQCTIIYIYISLREIPQNHHTPLKIMMKTQKCSFGSDDFPFQRWTLKDDTLNERKSKSSEIDGWKMNFGLFSRGDQLVLGSVTLYVIWKVYNFFEQWPFGFMYVSCTLESCSFGNQSLDVPVWPWKSYRCERFSHINHSLNIV